jgi:hypothetical protein
MKSNAKKFVQATENTKIVRVTNLQTHPTGQCWENAKDHSKATGSKIVNGWFIQPGDRCLNKDALSTVAKHYWNKLNGRYIDTTSIPSDLNGTYVLCKEQHLGYWLSNQDNFQYVLNWNPLILTSEENV